MPPVKTPAAAFADWKVGFEIFARPAPEENKLADALGTSIDFLISGDKDEKVKASLKDAELLQQFKAVEQFSDDDKTVVKKLIDAFIVKKQLQLMAS